MTILQDEQRNIQRQINEAEIRRAANVRDATERERLEAMQLSAAQTEAARIADLKRQLDSLTATQHLEAANAISAENAQHVANIFKALDSLQSGGSLEEIAGMLRAQRGIQSNQAAAFGALLDSIEKRAWQDVGWTPNDDDKTKRAKTATVQGQVRREASQVQRLLSPDDILIMWVQRAPEGHKQYRQGIAFVFIGRIVDPAPEWKPETHLQAYT